MLERKDRLGEGPICKAQRNASPLSGNLFTFDPGVRGVPTPVARAD